MSKKRERIEHRRQVAKARQRARAAAPREKSAAPPAPKSIAEKASYKDIWLAVGIVVLILAAFFAFYWFTVREPIKAKTGESHAASNRSGNGHPRRRATMERAARHVH
jgi:flagellar basal body-associated protein FliL